MITVGGGDEAGQELVGEDLWAWAISMGMFSLGSWIDKLIKEGKIEYKPKGQESAGVDLDD